METEDIGNPTRSNRDVACEVLRDIAQAEMLNEDIRIQAASLLLHADSEYSSAMLEIDAIADAVAARIKSEA